MNSNEKERLTKVEVKIDSMDKKLSHACEQVEAILINHLPHIRDDIAYLRIEVKENATKVAAIVGVISAVASLLANWLLG